MSSREFQRVVRNVLIGVEVVSRKRPYKLSAYNDSLEKTGRAARAMGREGQPQLANKLLNQAQKDYKQNSFVPFFKAILSDASGEKGEANAYFEEFLRLSRVYTEFDEAILSWQDHQRLRRSVYEFLVFRGVTFEGREKSIQTKIPLEHLMMYLMDPDPRDQFASLFFVIITIGGGLLLLFLNMTTDMEWNLPFLRSVPWLYGLVWICYGIWIVDLVAGFPAGFSRHNMIPWILGGALGFTFLSEVFSIIRERTRPLEDGYRRCPKCHAVIVKLANECPECRAKL